MPATAASKRRALPARKAFCSSSQSVSSSKAAVSAAKASGECVEISPVPTDSCLSRRRGSGMTATAAFRPGKLNALVGAKREIERASTSPRRLAMGIWRLVASRMMGQWISSLITTASLRRASSATASSSSRSYARPVGFWGLQNRMAAVAGDIFAARSSMSISQRPRVKARGEMTPRSPTLPGTFRMGP